MSLLSMHVLLFERSVVWNLAPDPTKVRWNVETLVVGEHSQPHALPRRLILLTKCQVLMKRLGA